MTLKSKLSLMNEENNLVDDYLQSTRSIADELTLAQSLVSDDGLVIIILNGLSLSFNNIATTLQARETTITYVELHKKLANHEPILKRQEAANITPISVNNVQRGRNKSSTFRSNTNSRPN